MKKKFDITKLLKGLVAFSLLFLLFACGSSEDVSDALDCGEEQLVDENAIEAQYKACWQGEVVSTIFVTTGKLVMSMYNKLTKGALALMMVAFAVWMTFQMLKHVSSFTEESPGEIWTEIIKKFFICMVCGILAGSPQGVLFVLNTIIFPIYNAFLELGSAMMGHISEHSTFHALRKDWNVPFSQNLQTEYDVICKVDEAMNKATLNGFPDSPRKMMECLTCSIGERMNFGIKLAWVAMKQGGVMAFVSGLIMMCCFMLVKLGFVFYLVDTIFRFAMMVMLLPLFIMAYAFKVTKKCVKVAFLTILNSAAFMMMIAVVMMMILVATKEVLVEHQQVFEDRDSLADFSVPFLLILLIAFLSIKSISIAKDICDKLVGGGGQARFQKTAAVLAALIAKKTFLGIAGKAMGWARGHSSKLQNMHNARLMAQNKLNSWAGRDEQK